MSKKYKIVISDTVVVPVKGTYTDAEGKAIPFKFSLTCKRMGADDFRDRMSQSETLIKDFLVEQTTGWSGQRLVLEDDDTPAEFNQDSFAALLDIAGMALLCFNAFSKEQAAQQKN